MRWVLILLVVPCLTGLPAHPLRAEDDPVLAGRGVGAEARRAEAARHIAALSSDDPTVVRRAVAWLTRVDLGEDPLPAAQGYEIVMLTGLRPEAEHLRTAVFQRLTRRPEDLRPFVGRVLARAAAGDTERAEPVRWLLAAVLADWRHGQKVKAAERAGTPEPVPPLQEHAAAVRTILGDPSVDLRIRVLLATHVHGLGRDAVALAPQAIAVAREAHEAMRAWQRANPERGIVAYDGPMSVPHEVGASLAHLGPEVIPLLRPLLTEKHLELSMLAVKGLADMGARAEPAVLRLLRDPDPEVRQAVLFVIGFMDGTSPARLAAVEAALADSHPQVQQAAAGRLIDQGRGGRAVAARIVRGPAGLLRTAVLASLGSDTGKVEGDLLEAVIERMAEPTDEEIPSLLALLDHRGARFVRATYGILRMLPHHDDDMRNRRDLLASLGHEGPAWFMTALESDAHDLHPYAARALAWGGPLEGALRARARTLLADQPDRPERLWLAAAIADERDTVALRILDEALDAGPWERRHIAAKTLAAMDGLGTRYLDRLVKAAAEVHTAYYATKGPHDPARVGQLVDIQDALQHVLERDPVRALPLLEHPSKGIRATARNIVHWMPERVAAAALAAWPAVPAGLRDPYLATIGKHADFQAVRAILLNEAAKEPVSARTQQGAPMTATAALLERAERKDVRARMARRLATEAVDGNRWAWNAITRVDDPTCRDAVIHALEVLVDDDRERVRIRARKLLARLRRQ